MPPKTTIALDLVLSDMRPKLLGERARYRVVHRNGATIEGKLTSVGDEAVQFKDAQGLVEIEKVDIAGIDKAVPDLQRQKLLVASVVALVMLAAIATTFALKMDPEMVNLVFLGVFGAGVLVIAIVRTALRSTFTTWEPVFPPPGTQVVDDRGRAVGPDY